MQIDKQQKDVASAVTPSKRPSEVNKTEKTKKNELKDEQLEKATGGTDGEPIGKACPKCGGPMLRYYTTKGKPYDVCSICGFCIQS